MACSAELTATADYAELHCLSNFTFLRGASHPEELVSQAKKLAYTAIALTDECSFAGIVRAHIQAKEEKIKLIIGSEFTFDDGLRCVFLVTSKKSYTQLSKLITLARRKATKGSYFIDRGLVESNPPEDCLALWLPPHPLEKIEQLLWLNVFFRKRGHIHSD